MLRFSLLRAWKGGPKIVGGGGASSGPLRDHVRSKFGARFNPHHVPGISNSQTANRNLNHKGLKSKMEQSVVFTEGYFGSALLRDKTEREVKIEDLTQQVFSKGNRYIRSCDEIKNLPLGRLSFPEVAICGNTNSGKSRLIGALLHNSRATRSGPARGNTILLSFLSVGDSFMIVDTPGYGGEWNKNHADKSFKRARAQSIVKQYINIRKHTNLKRVYICIAADVGVQNRDKEFMRFLIGEGVPFTIVMTFLDALVKHETANRSENHWREIMGEIPKAAKRIFDELGTDQIPFIEVNSRSGFNVDSLQKDMVFHCCQDIEKDEDVNLRNLRELSYSPPSAAAIIASEARYAPEHELMIDQDDITDVEYLEQYKSELAVQSKLLGRSLNPLVSLKEFADSGALTRSTPYSVASLTENTSDSSVGSDGEENDDHDGTTSVLDKNTIAASIPAVLEFNGGKKQQQQQQNLMSNATTTSESSLLSIVESTTAGKTDPELIVKRSSQPAVEEEDEESSSLPLKNPNPSILLASKVFTAPPPVRSVSSKNVSGSTSGNSSVVLHDFDEEGPPLVHKAPSSMVSQSIINNLAKMDKSAHKYKAMIENGWNQVMDDRNEHFMKHHEELGLKGNKRFQRREVLKKYVDHSGLRKDRAMKLDAQGFMNPFIGQDSTSEAVVGMSGAAPSSVRGTSKGGRMLGLKRRGFGGNSVSEKTFKGTGRSTTKLHKWAR